MPQMYIFIHIQEYTQPRIEMVSMGIKTDILTVYLHIWSVRNKLLLILVE